MAGRGEPVGRGVHGVGDLDPAQVRDRHPEVHEGAAVQLRAACLTGRGSAPVSYTHLDVYKRQLQVDAKFPGTTPDGQKGYRLARFVGIDGPRWFLRAVFTGGAAMPGTTAEVLDDAVRALVVAVSYTHLDVYKRQSRDRGTWPHPRGRAGAQRVRQWPGAGRSLMARASSSCLLYTSRCV